jgi:MFS family permease
MATEAEKEALPITSSITRTSQESSNAIAQDETSSPPKEPPAGNSSQADFPPQRTVLVVMAALFTASFLVALDRTIIGTAIPKITDDFHSLGDIGWYASAYLLTACSFQLLIGRIYTFYNPKWVFLVNIAIFEIGSIICGAAPNSTAFIVGRAVAGTGSAGIFSGAIILMVHTVPLHKRPAYTGVFGIVFGVSSVVGPLLGGVFTDGPSWRWCFWINLPLGGIAMVVIAFVLKLPNPKREQLTLTQQLHQLDPIGTAFFLPSVICLLLALQWGGTIYPWSNARVIALLTLCPVLFAAFIAEQLWKKETATIPPRIIKRRSVGAGMWLAFCNGSSMMTLVYYLPVVSIPENISPFVYLGECVLSRHFGHVCTSVAGNLLPH